MEVLRETPLTAGLGHPERRRLAGLCQVRRAEPGDILLREGSESAHLGIVRSGRLALRLQVPGRGSTTVLTVEAGDVFGWSAIVPPYRATSTVVAIEPSEVLVCEARALREALGEDEDLAAALAHPPGRRPPSRGHPPPAPRCVRARRGTGVVTAVEAPAFLRRDDIDRLITLLREDGRTVIGPTVSDGAIVYDEIRSARDLRRAGATSRGRARTAW